MSRRGMLAVVVVVAWAGGMAAFARRELRTNDDARLAEIALRVAPGATHFAVLREERHVGYASSTVDTLPSRLQVTDYLVADAMSGGSLRRETQRLSVKLTRRLELRDYLLTKTTDSMPLLVRGRVIADSVLEYVARAANGRPARALVSRSSVLPPRVMPLSVLPLVAMLAGPPRSGRELAFESLDPETGLSGRRDVRFVTDSLFVVSDSAVYDVQAARWRSVHNDTVRAWRLAGLPGALWVDRLGRAVRHVRPDGYTLQRTAYELAFENWRSASALSARR